LCVGVWVWMGGGWGGADSEVHSYAT